MEYIVRVERSLTNLGNKAIHADSDEEAYQKAKAWATSLKVTPSQATVLIIKKPDGGFKTFNRREF
jgi:hypothetical protein